MPDVQHAPPVAGIPDMKNIFPSNFSLQLKEKLKVETLIICLKERPSCVHIEMQHCAS